MRCYKRIRKSTQRYEPGFGSAIEWKSESVKIIFYMIQYGDFNIDADTDDILSLLDEWDVEYCMYYLSTFHMREYYVIKYQIHDTDNQMYME